MPEQVLGLTPQQWAAVAAIAAVAIAIATVVLAAATYWLGRKTRDMARETRSLAGTTSEELDLLRAQTKAQQDQLNEVRRGRVPNLRWQSPEAHHGMETGHTATGLRFVDGKKLGVDVVLRNEGGPARVKSLVAECSTGEKFYPFGFDVPCTVPAGEALTLRLRTDDLQAIQMGERTLSIELAYSDLEGEHPSETRPRLRVVFDGPRTSATFIDSDERSPYERELPHRGTA